MLTGGKKNGSRPRLSRPDQGTSPGSWTLFTVHSKGSGAGSSGPRTFHHGLFPGTQGKAPLCQASRRLREGPLYKKLCWFPGTGAMLKRKLSTLGTPWPSEKDELTKSARGGGMSLSPVCTGLLPGALFSTQSGEPVLGHPHRPT